MKLSGQVQPLSLYPRGNSPRHRLVRRLVRLHCRSWRGGEVKKKSIRCLCRESNPEYLTTVTGEGKVVPVLQLSTTPWRRIGEWRYSSTHYLTLALDGDGWSAFVCISYLFHACYIPHPPLPLNINVLLTLKFFPGCVCIVLHYPWTEFHVL